LTVGISRRFLIEAWENGSAVLLDVVLPIIEGHALGQALAEPQIVVQDLPADAARQQISGLTERAEMAIKSWQSKKLVRRSHLRTIVAAWLITVPATALIAALIYLIMLSVPLFDWAD